MTSFKVWTLCAALAAALPSCVIVDDGDDDPGTLTVGYSIDGSLEPADCAFFGFDRLELEVYEIDDPDVYDVFDDPVVTTYASCEDFELSLRLPGGRYRAYATLLDSRDVPATTTQELNDLRVISDRELYVPIDFPASSFR